jgi:hypothetical protein
MGGGSSSMMVNQDRKWKVGKKEEVVVGLIFLFLRALTYYLFSYCVQNSRTNVNFYMAHPYYLLW